MNIIHLIAPGIMAGAENIVVHGVKALQQHNPNTHLVVFEELRCAATQAPFFEALERLNIPHHRIPTRRQIDLRALKQLRQILRTLQPDVIHTHGFKALVYSTLSAPATKTVCTHHGETQHTWLARQYERLARALYHQINKVCVVSQPTQEMLAQAHPALQKRLTVIENFISPERLRPVVEPEFANMQLTFIGRLSPEKGPHHLLRALEQCPETLDVHIIGDGPMRTELEQMAITLPQTINFYGFVKDPIDLMQRSNVLVMPSATEGMPLVAIEALCHGVPVLATAVGALPQLVEHNHTGHLLANNTPKTLARGINTAFHQHNIWRKHAVHAVDQARHRFSANRWAKRTLDLYHSL